jgi:hypothetical protein
MTDQELRALVREAIAHHTGSRGPAPVSPAPAVLFRQHVSHGMFTLPVGADADGPCVIEPTVTCNHCGYCKSYGH